MAVEEAEEEAAVAAATPSKNKRKGMQYEYLLDLYDFGTGVSNHLACLQSI